MSTHLSHIRFINPPTLSSPPGYTNAALAAVDANFTHVIKLNFFLVDMTHLPILREVRDRYINTQHPPASTAVEVSRLAHPDLLLEVEAIASLPA